MFILGIIIWGGLFLYIYLAKKAYQKTKQKFPQKLYLSKLILAFFILLPTYDIILTNIFAGYYCLISPPHPKTKIIKKVEYPESIYWEDNVYPGFDKQDRELMIINYLDGVHLKTMALNGSDNKRVYVYHLDKPIWKEFKKRYKIYIKQHPPKQDRFRGHGFDVYKAYAKEIMKTEKIYTKETMPKLNFTVTFNEVKLNSFARKFLYCDETKVIENNTNKVIAYNRRYMRFFYNIFPDFELGDRYYSEAMCGDEYRFDEKVFSSLKFMYGGEVMGKKSLNEVLYDRYVIKGEK
jgi:hypothetical protein